MNQTTKPIFLHVPTRDAQTLQAIIRETVPGGSTIVSDGWRGYIGIDQHNYQHLTVNHSMNFVDPNTGRLMCTYIYVNFRCVCVAGVCDIKWF